MPEPTAVKIRIVPGATKSLYKVERLSAGVWKPAITVRGDSPWPRHVLAAVLPQWRAKDIEIDLTEAPELAQ